MTRQEKKYLLATVGFHLLMVVILLVGPGFFSHVPAQDQTQLLDVIPTDAVEAALNSGVKHASVPPPSPIVNPPPPITPPPPIPTPQPPPRPEPAPSFVQKVEKFFKPEPDPIIPQAADDAPRPPSHKTKHSHVIKVDLSKIERNTSTSSSVSSSENRREDLERSEAFNSAVRNLESHFSSSTHVEMPGSSSVSYASYASIIRSIYTRAWEPPNDAANDLANIKVRITVSRDGSVEASEILEPSGDPAVDASVQRTLDRVTFIAPFPEGATENQKTFIINFNLKAKHMLG